MLAIAKLLHVLCFWIIFCNVTGATSTQVISSKRFYVWTAGKPDLKNHRRASAGDDKIPPQLKSEWAHPSIGDELHGTSADKTRYIPFPFFYSKIKWTTAKSTQCPTKTVLYHIESHVWRTLKRTLGSLPFTRKTKKRYILIHLESFRNYWPLLLLFLSF